MIKLQDIKKNEEVKNFLRVAEMQLAAQGFTEHSFRHVGLVSKTAGNILSSLEYSEREIELARTAGYLHDIGNAVNRNIEIAIQVMDRLVANGNECC
jgi:HD superfamily phosphodiesterase